MPRASHASAPIAADYGPVSERTAHLDDTYTVNFVTFHVDGDHAPLLKGLPDDACQCPHWGYVLSGLFTVRYTSGVQEQLAAGDAFYLPPGHVPSVIAGTEIVLISPTDQLELTEAAMQANMNNVRTGTSSTPTTS